MHFHKSLYMYVYFFLENYIFVKSVEIKERLKA